MRNFFLLIAILASTLTSGYLAAECCQSYEVGLGWRRDDLHWKSSVENDYIDYSATSDIKFRNVQSYTVYGKAKFSDEAYYIRLDADYGWTEKGRSDEKISVDTPYFSTLSVLENHVRKRSEVYDFSGAVGYPFMFWGCRAYVVPLIGLSWQRQRICVHDDRVFLQEFSSSSSESSFSSSSFYSSSSDSYSTSSDNPLGLHPHGNGSMYRFTWYGPFVGVDAAYCFDDTWTIFGQLDFHFLNRAHGKRSSNVGLDFVDSNHREGYAYGTKGVVGATVYFGCEWFMTFNVDFKWFRAKQSHDTMSWSGIGSNVNVGMMF